MLKIEFSYYFRGTIKTTDYAFWFSSQDNMIYFSSTDEDKIVKFKFKHNPKCKHTWTLSTTQISSKYDLQTFFEIAKKEVEKGDDRDKSEWVYLIDCAFWEANHNRKREF